MKITNTAKILSKPARIHLMGIAGVAMGSFAGLLQSMGHIVTGSDQNVYPPMSYVLKSLNIATYEGYKPENILQAKPELVVVGNVITKTNPEMLKLLELDEIPYISFPEALGEIAIGERQSLVICGTHGKTTTTAASAFAARKSGVKAGYLIGGVPQGLPSSFAAPEDPFFIVEGDEYDVAFFDKRPKFVHYRPTVAVINALEFDHADIYRDLDHVIESFGLLIDALKPEGTLIYLKTDPNIEKLLRLKKDILKTKNIHLISFGFSESADAEMHSKGANSFELNYKGEKINFNPQMFGDYNFLNITASFLGLLTLGLKKQDVISNLNEFRGVKRRQEILGEKDGVTYIEDFAHHPTAVKLTLEALRAKYPNRRLISIFEPRSATSRRAVFQTDYAHAFAKSDIAVFAKPFKHELLPEDNRLSTTQIVDYLKDTSHIQASEFGSVDEIVAFLQKTRKPQDVVVIMSNGGFDGIYTKLLGGRS